MPSPSRREVRRLTAAPRHGTVPRPCAPGQPPSEHGHWARCRQRAPRGHPLALQHLGTRGDSPLFRSYCVQGRVRFDAVATNPRVSGSLPARPQGRGHVDRLHDPAGRRSRSGDRGRDRAPGPRGRTVLGQTTRHPRRSSAPTKPSATITIAWKAIFGLWYCATRSSRSTRHRPNKRAPRWPFGRRTANTTGLRTAAAISWPDVTAPIRACFAGDGARRVSQGRHGGG